MRKHIVTIVLGAIVIVLAFSYYDSGMRRRKLDYDQSLDELAVQVNGEGLTLLDMAYYVALEEKTVEEEAQVYNPDKPWKYWEVRTNGQYMRADARDTAMNMAIHDELFFQLAMENGVELDSGEMDYLANAQSDFWSDLTDNDAQYRLGITQEQLNSEMEKAAIAKKYQTIYAEINGVSVEQCDFSGETYLELLEKNKYEINESVWKNVDFGNITTDREEVN